MVMIVSTELESIQINSKNSFSARPLIGISKRLFDLFIAGCVALFVLIWMIPIIGILIKLTSPGPIFFIQMRNGHKGRTFPCFKFRTMLDGGNQPFKQVTRDDPKITPIGRFLRKNNLDEMPQFINVLLGDMSIVGPRPHAIKHDEEYWAVLPYYAERYTIRPGITGLAQVRGARGLTENIKKMERRLRYDLYYVKNRSFLFDMLICWWTVKTTILGDENAS